jgi:ABC-type transport system involved in cytochrome c biogenesis permease subunit
VFIGWGCVLLSLILEAIYRNGIGLFAAGVLGFATSLVAHFLGTDGDTLEMLQAVLDTNFWLATHVTIVNLGYTATLVPGFLGVVYIIRGLCTRSLTSVATKTMGQMIYGIICFATLLSFTGTVLGGIWADQSWGRFWGWDPKENGALLIVIWNAMILHARWGGMIKTRGMAILAVLGNIVTIWSWFGTNQLGVGLHAYGFRSGMAKWIVISSAVHLAIAGLGMLPVKYWRSNNSPSSVAKPRNGREVELPA